MILRVKEILKERGMTIQELADQIQVHRVTLSNSINGNPTLEILQKIAAVFNLSMSELFFDEVQPKTSKVPTKRPEKYYKTQTNRTLKEIIRRIESENKD